MKQLRELSGCCISLLLAACGARDLGLAPEDDVPVLALAEDGGAPPGDSDTDQETTGINSPGTPGNAAPTELGSVPGTAPGATPEEPAVTPPPPMGVGVVGEGSPLPSDTMDPAMDPAVVTPIPVTTDVPAMMPLPADPGMEAVTPPAPTMEAPPPVATTPLPTPPPSTDPTMMPTAPVPTEPEVPPTPVEEPEPIISLPGPPLWAAVPITNSTPEVVIDVRNPERWVQLQVARDGVRNQPIASPDGTVVAHDTPGGLELYRLPTSDTDIGQRLTPFDGLGQAQALTPYGQGLLARVGNDLYRLDDSDADPVAISAALPDADLYSATVSPAAEVFFFAWYDGEAFGMSWLPLPGGTDFISAVLRDASSPALSPVWSPDGQWLAFGASPNGVFLWDSRGSADPIAVNANYSPYYSFSPDGTRLLIHTGAGLIVRALSSPAVAQVVGASNPSPGEWSVDGSYVTYTEGSTGYVTPVDVAGNPGDPIEVPGLGFGCVVGWPSPSELLYQDCTNGTRGPLLYAEVVGDAVETTEFAEGLPNVTVSPSRQCFANWGGTDLGVASMAGVGVAAAATAAATINYVLWAPDDSGILWSSGQGASTALFFMNTSDCLPTSEPLNISASIGREPQYPAFLARP